MRKKNTKETTRESGEDVAKRWIAAVIKGVQKFTDKDQQIKILELCGHNCAQYDLKILKKLKKNAKDHRELLDFMNKHIPWCGQWTWEKDYIHSICKSCGCPLVHGHYVPLNPIFCLCSQGYVKTIFSEAFGREVSVTLSKAIGRGDTYCEFFVYLK